jgi:hypothetical protein
LTYEAGTWKPSPTIHDILDTGVRITAMKSNLAAIALAFAMETVTTTRPAAQVGESQGDPHVDCRPHHSSMIAGRRYFTQLPTPDDMRRARYGLPDYRLPVLATITIDCAIISSGKLDACKIIYRTPDNSDFDSAAFFLAGKILVDVLDYPPPDKCRIQIPLKILSD